MKSYGWLKAYKGNYGYLLRIYWPDIDVGNSFSTIACPLGTNPVASTPSDTLTLTSTGGTMKITGNSVTDTVNFDFKDITAASRVLGRGSAAGAGVVQELTLGTALSMSGTTINCTALTSFTVTSSDSSLTISGGSDAIININHTNQWNIYQGNNETSHSPVTNGDVWLDANQHAMAFSIGGYSPSENSITEWPEGCIYSMYSPYITDRTTDPNPSWWA